MEAQEPFQRSTFENTQMPGLPQTKQDVCCALATPHTAGTDLIPLEAYPKAVPCFLPLVEVPWRKDQDISRDSS